MQVLRLQPLSPEELGGVLHRALTDPVRGLGGGTPPFAPDAVQAIVNGAGGDARVALNWAETAAAYANQTSAPEVDAELVARATLERQVQYERAGDEHYDTISAFIKSVRGSDPDAALFWLAKMLRAGEQPEFLARRLLILASEDIGNADPQALPMAVAAASAVERLGMPEARYAMSQITIYLACAPKSNAAGRALSAAEAAFEASEDVSVPLHLRNPAFQGAGGYGYGTDYMYPHDFPGNYVKQSYLPDGAARAGFYDGQGTGHERLMWEALQRRRRSDRDADEDET
jgi:putative ATPase